MQLILISLLGGLAATTYIQMRRLNPEAPDTPQQKTSYLIAIIGAIGLMVLCLIKLVTQK